MKHETHTCAYCGTDPGPRSNKPSVWNGFYDADTWQYVCWKCRDAHYRTKNATDLKHLYSEMPVTCLNQTKNELPPALLNNEGYPIEEYIDYLRKWKPDDMAAEEFVGFVLHDGWWMPDWGFKFHRRRNNIRTLELHTGGWSGNEEVISVLRQNIYFWSFWTMTRAGGHYWFSIPCFVKKGK